nr:MAG TPA: hypothetical protein [Caudoviricetes sp.]
MWNKLIAIILIVGFFATLYFSLKKSIVLEVEKKKDAQTIEVIKHDAKKKAKIIALPNPKRDDIIELMLHNQF